MLTSSQKEELQRTRLELEEAKAYVTQAYIDFAAAKNRTHDEFLLSEVLWLVDLTTQVRVMLSPELQAD